MPQTATGASRSDFAPVIIEEATVVDVNKRNFTVSAITRHTSKRYDDLQCALPYFHNDNGEGIYFLPEVGAVCQIFRGSDTTPPFILGFLAIPAVTESADGTPLRSTSSGGSSTDVSFRGRRLDILPGDIVMATRDENFVVLRRGGVLQLGATDLAQRMYIPIGNYIRDFCENYRLDTLGGDLSWTVERQENDPGGDAPVSYAFHLREFAQDEKASFRVRHLPPQGTSTEEKSVWEVTVAKNKINTETGAVSDETYTMVVAMDGTKTEFVGASYSVRVTGDFLLEADGNATVRSSKKALVEGTQEARLKGTTKAVVEGASVLVGGDDAVEPAPLGAQLMTYLGTLAGAAGAPPPPPTLLSRKVKVSS